MFVLMKLLEDFLGSVMLSYEYYFSCPDIDALWTMFQNTDFLILDQYVHSNPVLLKKSKGQACVPSSPLLHKMTSMPTYMRKG